jgi:hypothetical protein
MERLVDSEIRSYRAYSADDQLRHRGPDPGLDGTSLIVILLLSLGLWAAIWGGVAALASAVLR